MSSKGIAVWFLTPDGRALLKQRQSEQYGAVITEPLKTWKKSYESIEGAIVRVVREEIPQLLPARPQRLHFSKITDEPVPEENIKGGAVRLHYCCQLSLPLLAQESIILFGKEDLPRIRKLTDKDKKQRDLVFFEEDHDILLKLLGVQTILTTT